MTDEVLPTVCITHGAFIPCRKEGPHEYTDDPKWVKRVRAFQESPDTTLAWVKEEQ